MFTSWFMHNSRKSWRMCTWIGRKPAMAAPIATPVIASSDSGVSNTRPGPNFSASPRVVPLMPLWSSTPRPNSTTDGSRPITWSVASRIASTYDSRRSSVLVRIDMRPQLLIGRVRTCIGERERVGDLILHLLFDARPQGRRQKGSGPLHLVVFQPRPSFVDRAVAAQKIFRWAHVLEPTIGRHFD